MIRRLKLWRVLGAMAVLAALSLAPQAANAHAGHSHGHHSSAAIAATQPAVPAVDAKAVHAQELTEADPAAPSAEDACGGRVCCSSGPCTGCHGLVITPVPATVPPTQTSIVRPDDPPAHLGAETTRLRRPPKSFV
jgi:hypothetical protein